MSRDVTAEELSFIIIEAMFHQFITKNKYYLNVNTFVGQQINKRSLGDWKLCRYNHGHHDNVDSLISVTVIMKKKDEIDHIKKRWVDLYLQNDTRDDLIPQLSCSSLHINMIFWCDDEFSFWHLVTNVKGNYCIIL